MFNAYSATKSAAWSFTNALRNGKNAGAKAEKLPTKEEEIAIRKEIESLPPFATDDSYMVAIRNAQMLRGKIAAIAASTSSSLFNPRLP
jgi:hypothetical protein